MPKHVIKLKANDNATANLCPAEHTANTLLERLSDHYADIANVTQRLTAAC